MTSEGQGGCARLDRRSFLGATLLGVGSVALGGSLWRSSAGPVAASPGPYGALLPADRNGVRLPPGFISRIVARTGHPVAASAYP